MVFDLPDVKGPHTSSSTKNVYGSRLNISDSVWEVISGT